MTTLLKIVRLLPALSDTELIELVARIKSLREVGHALVGVGASVASDEQLVLDVIGQQLARMGVEYPPAALLLLAARKKLADGHSFREKIPPLMQFLSRAHPTLIGQRAILALGVELLYRDITARGLVVTHRTLMAHIHRVPPVLDRHFPGYARAGLLGWVVDKPAATQAAQARHM